MSKGYLILAQDTEETDYIRLAYALALSIKSTQSTVNNVCLATTKNISTLNPKLSTVFDHIVNVPWRDNAEKSKWKIENKWKYYYMTPFDETVILDADMVFTEDISHWWNILQNSDIWFTTDPKTFKGESITSTIYRSTFVTNNLPNIYTAFMYFKQNKLVGELFKLIELIFEHWERFYYEYLDETRPKFLSGDVAYALAVKILGIENECMNRHSSIPTFVHMKGLQQNINQALISENWTAHIPTYFRNNGRFKIGNYEQTLPFHYHIKDWMTDEKIEVYEKILGLS